MSNQIICNQAGSYLTREHGQGPTDLVALVDGRGSPERVGYSQSAVLSLEVQKTPLLPPFRLIHVGLVGEAVQLLILF